MEYVIPGNPIPLHRARGSKHGYYDDQFQLKKNIQWLFKETYGKVEPLKCPLSLTITFYMPIPKSISKKKHAALIGQPHAKTPDTSNLIKLPEDCFNGILWEDDCLICHLDAKKLYDEDPRTVFEIKEIL